MIKSKVAAKRYAEGQPYASPRQAFLAGVYWATVEARKNHCNQAQAHDWGEGD